MRRKDCKTNYSKGANDIEAVKTIIKIRKGVNGFKYSACDKNGYFIGNFRKLADVRKYWRKGVKRGCVELMHELDKEPDLTKWEEENRLLNEVIKLYTKI